MYIVIAIAFVLPVIVWLVGAYFAFSTELGWVWVLTGASYLVSIALGAGAVALLTYGAGIWFGVVITWVIGTILAWVGAYYANYGSR